MRQRVRNCGILLTMLMLSGMSALANNSSVVHVRLTDEVSGSHVIAELDLSWENSWRNDVAGAGQASPFNYDAVWLFVKFSTDQGVSWQHATLSATSAHHQVASDHGVAATIQAVPDGKGVFAFRRDNGAGAIDWNDVRLRWNYAADGLASITSATVIKVLALEMVYIPAGSFWVGDGSPAPIQGQFEAGVSGQPFAVTGESAITLGGGSAGSLGNNNAAGMAHADDFDDQRVQTLPAVYPKGFSAFYVMKHEITQGQYADFLNTLTRKQATWRNVATWSNYETFRGTISGSHPVLSASRPDRACNFMSWMDGAAYTDWAGLRPMTELEYEKICRGSQASVAGEFAWGTTQILAAGILSGQENGTEVVLTANANSVFNEIIFSGGDGGKGPLRSGIFAAVVNPADPPSDQRQHAGAAFYGVMELSGNLWERTVMVGHVSGRRFIGSHGDGHLTTEPGYEGNATNPDWPGFNSISARGVTGADGAGFRGGSWSDPTQWLRTSDRACAATVDQVRRNNHGFRCVRTAP